MSHSSSGSYSVQRRLESFQRRGRVSRHASTTIKSVVSRFDAYTFALRAAYLHHLLQPKAKRLQHVPASRPTLPRQTTSVADLVKDFSSTRDSKTISLPKGFMLALDDRITGVLMDREKMPGYGDASVKRTFAAFLNEFKKPEFRRSMEKDRRAEDLLLIFYSNATKVLQLGKTPGDDGWRLMVDRHVALFVRLINSMLKTGDWAKDKTELSGRLKILETKLLSHDQDLVEASQRNGGAGGVTQEVEIPRSQQVKDMPLVQTVAGIFGKTLSQVQVDIDDQKDLWTEKNALQDIKMYQTNMSLHNRRTLRSDDFDTDDAYQIWKKDETRDLSQMVLSLVQSNPDLAKSASVPTHYPKTPNGISNGSDLSNLTRTFSEQSTASSPYVIDTPVDMSMLSLNDDPDNAYPKPDADDGEPYMFIPPDPRNYYRVVLNEALSHDLLNPSRETDSPDPKLLSRSTMELLREIGVRWRLPLSSRLVLFLDIVRDKFIDRELDLDSLDAAFSYFKDPPLGKNSSVDTSTMFDRTRWTLADYVLNQQVLVSVHDALLRDFFEEMEHCYEAKPFGVGPIMMVLESHIYDDSLFSRTPDDLDRFSDQLYEAVQARALATYNATFIKEISQHGSKAEFFHVIQLGNALIKIIERAEKRFRKTPQIMGVKPFDILVEVVFPAYGADVRSQVSSMINRAQSQGEEIAIQDGFELYKELVKVRQLHGQLLPNAHFSLNVEDLLQSFVWRWIAAVEGKVTSWVDEAVKQDNFRVRIQDDGQPATLDQRHSVSVIDIFRSFNEAVDQLATLEWDDDLQYAKFMTALSKSIGSGVTRYCDQLEQSFIKEMDRLTPEQEASIMQSRQEKWIRMAKDAIASKEKVEPFQFLPESLVKLNNIEYAMLQLDKLEKGMNADACADVIRKREPPTTPRRKDETFLFTVKIIEAEDLRPCDSNGLSDPYVVLVDEMQKRLYKTRIIYANLNPRWDETVDIMTKGPVNLIATIWDWDHLGDHDCCGRTAVKLDPVAFKDFLPREYWLDLDTQGRLLVRISMEGEKDDIQFYFGKTFRALKRTIRDMTRKITDKLSAYMQQCLSRRTLRSLTSRGITISTVSSYFQRNRPPPASQAPTDMDIETALKPLFGYFNENFAIMNQTLTPDAMVTVMTRLWKDTLAIIESLLVPPLSDKLSSQRQLTAQELDIVFKWLTMLFEFFHAVDETTGKSEGVPVDILKNPKYHDIQNLNFFYFEPTENLMRTSERMAAATAERQRQTQARTNRISAPAMMGSTHTFGGARGMIGYTSTKRSKTILLSRNLGTMKKAKEEKRKEAQAEPSDDMILRILRMRPEAEKYLRDRARQKERLAAMAAAEQIVRQSLGTAEARQLLAPYPGGVDMYLKGL